MSRINGRLNEVLAKSRYGAELREKENSRAELHHQTRVDNAQYDMFEDNSDTIFTGNAEVSASLLSPAVSEYDLTRYFDDDYKPTLIELAKSILEKKNGITLYELVSDIANSHGISRTSKRQSEHIFKLIKPWAGIKRYSDKESVVWSCPEDVVDEIPWRGLDIFGDKREWKDIPYPEAKGLARLAIRKSPDNPVDFICSVFKLKRRHGKTLHVFQTWVDDISQNTD